MCCSEQRLHLCFHQTHPRDNGESTQIKEKENKRFFQINIKNRELPKLFELIEK